MIMCSPSKYAFTPPEPAKVETELLPVSFVKIPKAGTYEGEDCILLTFVKLTNPVEESLVDITESPFSVTNPITKLFPANEEESELQYVYAHVLVKEKTLNVQSLPELVE